ncbi:MULTISPECIES: hypothetical protein [unclassified Bradyrhizobium]|uniref:hypothetical protein n=1 Tax=unclassified Bradyrhizobium TaxID=2631580 RepID=UPI00247AF669|nr:MULTISPECIES: hypothetical protein [unclassified Bradyrhizobium]WGR72923.1 hypothetical protein MTX24_08545 [Bradyrhizobium sp. ISRA426]WGR77758.1 hypothetical protein MTX21_33500 [Bradyrhizobium sp. ISRA430]WGR88163.1 hypothetical protein MTX25_08550 [Bradyrhizobium sp. ISRA432]
MADVQIGGELTGELGSRRRLVRQRMQADHEAACFPVNRRVSTSDRILIVRARFRDHVLSADSAEHLCHACHHAPGRGLGLAMMRRKVCLLPDHGARLLVAAQRAQLGFRQTSIGALDVTAVPDAQ